MTLEKNVYNRTVYTEVCNGTCTQNKNIKTKFFFIFFITYRI